MKPKVKNLILSNWSQNIAEINAITAPNKQAYADKHGYTFENVEWDYSKHVEWLELLRELLGSYEAVMTMGCDTLFMNYEQPISVYETPILTKEHASWWPINNDVMIWPNNATSRTVIEALIRDSRTWLDYPWLWQAHLWDLMRGELRYHVGIVEARQMNSTWKLGLSQWQLGDWIFHALDLPKETKVEVLKTYVQYAGDGTYRNLPKILTKRK